MCLCAVIRYLRFQKVNLRRIIDLYLGVHTIAEHSLLKYLSFLARCTSALCVTDVIMVYYLNEV